MATTKTEVAKTKATALDKSGAAVAVLSVIAIAVPIAYQAYASSGAVTLAKSDDVKSLFTNGIIVTGAAAVLGLIGLVLSLPGLLKGRSVGRMLTSAVSLIVLVASVLGLVLVIMPRASAVQNLSDNIQPFAVSLRDNCQTPLNNLATHESDLLTHSLQSQTGDAAGDALFVQDMQADLANLKADAAALQTASGKLSKVTVPSGSPDYYKELLTHCQQDVANQADFLTNDSGANAIALPAPFNAISPKVSLTSLVGGSALIASGTSPLGKLPPGTVETVMAGAMQQVIAGSKDQVATDDGKKLTADIKKTLTDNLSPIPVDADAIVGN